VILVGDPHKATLLDFTYRRRFQAERGTHGQGADKRGRDGRPARLRVPLGTVVRTPDGETLGEVVCPDEELLVAAGGRGGRGNASFKSATHQAPRRADPGAPGETRRLLLELKLIADAGLVGRPNAGKSTLLTALSAATPKIADYPFTTLSPVLGVVRVDDESSFVLADIPGLLEGAHAGRGLGHDFLRHVERTRVLLFVVDISGDVEADVAMLRRELETYAEPLADRDRIIVLNKIDLVEEATVESMRSRLALKEEVVAISARTRAGVDTLVRVTAGRLAALSRSSDPD
jgi:GTP-binding protein